MGVRLGDTWERAVVTATHPTPRSYVVTTEDGEDEAYRRNQRFINQSPDEATIVPNLDSTPAQSSTPAQPSRIDIEAPTFPSPVCVPAELPTPEPRRGARIKSIPGWQKDFVMKP